MAYQGLFIGINSMPTTKVQYPNTSRCKTMASERYYHFILNIDPEELMRVYRGSAHRLRVRSVEGSVIDIDANHLRKFTTRSGVQGRFRLAVSDTNKFLRLERI